MYGLSLQTYFLFPIFSHERHWFISFRIDLLNWNLALYCWFTLRGTIRRIIGTSPAHRLEWCGPPCHKGAHLWGTQWWNSSRLSIQIIKSFLSKPFWISFSWSWGSWNCSYCFLLWPLETWESQICLLATWRELVCFHLWPWLISLPWYSWHPDFYAYLFSFFWYCNYS